MRRSPVKPDEYAACWRRSRFFFAGCQAPDTKSAGQPASQERSKAQLKAAAPAQAFAIDRVIHIRAFFQAGTSLAFEEEFRGVHQSPEQVLYSVSSVPGRSPHSGDSSRADADFFVLWVSRINEQVQFFYDFLR